MLKKGYAIATGGASLRVRLPGLKKKSGSPDPLPPDEHDPLSYLSRWFVAPEIEQDSPRWKQPDCHGNPGSGRANRRNPGKPSDCNE